MSIIRNFSLYTQQWYISYRFADSLGAISLASYRQTCMIYTIVVCTVKNSWWWTEELSKTCRVLFQYKFEKLVRLVGFLIRSHLFCFTFFALVSVQTIFLVSVHFCVTTQFQTLCPSIMTEDGSCSFHLYLTNKTLSDVGSCPLKAQIHVSSDLSVYDS